MKRFLACIPILLLILTGLSGCGMTGEKNADLSIIYAAVAVLALLLLGAYLRLVKHKSAWFTVLFSAVSVVNIGYFWLSVSPGLGQALMANRVSYLGSVLLPLSMLMAILDITGTKYKKKLPHVLLGIAGMVFLLAASPGILDLYYREVSFAVVGGVSTLQKAYGPLHPVYLLYLLGYFAAMIVVIVRTAAGTQRSGTAHAAILIIAVFVNIGVWLMEQLMQLEFELLSVSYIISELFLLGIHLMVSENRRLNTLANAAQAVQGFTPVPCADPVSMSVPPDRIALPDPDRCAAFATGLAQLTQTEKAIYEAYLARLTTKEIMAALNIKENTLKFHNKNLYGKLGVSSRKELMEVYRQLAAMKEPECEADTGRHP